MTDRQPSGAGQRQSHILTVNVEDYFHVGAFEGTVLRKHWTRFPSRLERNVQEVLELLDKHGAKATFFVLGWIADRQPNVVADIVNAGHEVASRGYWPGGSIRTRVRDEFREDIRRSRQALEAAGASPVVGYRSSQWIHAQDAWILDILAEEGFQYDSSINPILRRFAWDPRCFEVNRHRHSASDLTLWEYPISTLGLLGLRVAISGGNYLRQLPHPVMRRAVRWWTKHRRSPLVFYFMSWEMDKDQPEVRSLPRLNRIRHYRNLERMPEVLDYYLSHYEFQSIGDDLGIERATQAPRRERASGIIDLGTDAITPPTVSPDAQPVTLVIPLYNEDANVTYLHRTLLELRRKLGQKYRILFNLVDDGSSDSTWTALEARFRNVPDCRLLRHPRNLGIGAALVTGIRAATTDVVCSLDCDCSYDPSELEAMIPMLDHADLVTASPYHPQGHVFNVPPWRLFLSKTLSRLYSASLGDRIHTYTSCCRVYRKSSVDRIELRNPGFLGVAELLIQAKLAGARIVEHPATLESRLFGESKMKIVRTILAHLGLLRDLALRRPVLYLASAPAAGEAPSPSAVPAPSNS
ncbi:MAG: DUF3473 domain-containing protein [Deltaproteobacteria bacterium]|nr:DUF3473 domain-containing protein [Deltaproteobacteria bacterium]